MAQSAQQRFCIKWGPDWRPSNVIYTWLQVNGVSVTDPSLSDLSDLLFLLMSSFFSLIFHPSLVSSAPLFPSVISLLKAKKKSTLPVFRSRCLIFCFFPPFSHTHIPSWALASTIPSNLLHALVPQGAGWSITWFNGSYYRPGFPGQDAGIFIEADKGRPKTSHPLSKKKKKTTSHRCDLLSFFFPFREMSNTICYPHCLVVRDIQ